MAMVVKNNMSAVRTLNTLNKNSSALSKSLAKVSSGMKINSAQDDASGYAISERMRVQIRSLDQANQNTQNASSLMKTAEGALSSTIEILKSLKEKAVNAATDTNTDSDRATIQKEINQFIDQIDDNALTTFNGKYLIDGSKKQQGIATKTAMTNQSLGLNDVEGNELGSDTKLTNLTNRNNESLEISSTDKVTASFVKGGKTYTTTYTVSDTTLQDIFTKLNSEYRSELGTTDSSVAAFGDATAKSAASSSVDSSAMDTAYATLQAAYTSLGTALSSLTSWSAASADIQNGVTSWYASLKNGSTYSAANADDLPSDSVGFKPYWVADLTGSGSSATAAAAYSAYNTAVSNYNTEKAAYDAEVAANSGGGDASGGIVSRGSTVGMGPGGSDSDYVETADGEIGWTVTAADEGVEGQISGLTISISDSEGNVKKSANASLDAFQTTIFATNKSDANELSFHVGASANQAIAVGMDDMRAEALGLKGSDGSKVSVATQDKANAAIDVFDNALQKALDQQATIGAIEARLDYTSQNLTTSSENVQAAESTIRDADMAKEMTEYTKNNVLLQAAQSMLAQANQNSSAVLSLLQ